MPLIEITPHDLTQTASKVNVEIYEFDFGTKITLKISFFNSQDAFLLHKFIVLEGQNYIDMTTSQASDTFIRNFVETQLGITFII